MANLKIGKMVLRSLFGKPATQMYPVIPRAWKECTRGRIEIEIDACIFCGICARKCPADAITVERTAKTWTISRMGCIQCSCCVEVCPKSCLNNVAGYTSPDTTQIVDTFTKAEETPKTEKTQKAEDAVKTEAVPKPEAAVKTDDAPAPETTGAE